LISLFFSFQNPDCGEIAQISYRYQTLAAACSNNTVKIWSRHSDASSL
jgi:hypothetical protein